MSPADGRASGRRTAVRGCGTSPGWRDLVCLGTSAGLPAWTRRCACRRICATGFEELAGFFRKLAADWCGWRGEWAYESLERELRLTATRDGHVRPAVFLRQSGVPDGWSAAAVMRLDPGEEMTRVAGDVAALLVPLQL
jgi:hypothetical protein